MWPLQKELSAGTELEPESDRDCKFLISKHKLLVMQLQAVKCLNRFTVVDFAGGCLLDKSTPDRGRLRSLSTPTVMSAVEVGQHFRIGCDGASGP